MAIASPRSTGVKLPVASTTTPSGGDIIGLVVSGIAAASASAFATASAAAAAASASVFASASASAAAVA